MTYKEIFGVLATIVGFLGYLPYLIDMFRGKNKPHTFSWFVWGLIAAIAFFAQVAKGGGAGTWPTAITALLSFFIAGFAVTKKDKQIHPSDWIALLGALFAIVLWRLTHDPLFAIISVATADALGFIPTFRKAFHRPYEETVIGYSLGALKWIISIPALGALNLTTWLYPVSLIFTDLTFVTMSLLRRRTVSRTERV